MCLTIIAYSLQEESYVTKESHHLFTYANIFNFHHCMYTYKYISFLSKLFKINFFRPLSVCVLPMPFREVLTMPFREVLPMPFKDSNKTAYLPHKRQQKRVDMGLTPLLEKTLTVKSNQL